MNMKKTLAVILFLMLPLAWVWAAGEDAKSADSPDNQESVWQPALEEIVEHPNPQPALQSYRNSTPGEELDPPVITTTLLSEDFEDGAWGDPSSPPPGWTILDKGTEGSQAWYNQDWHKYYFSAWSDTVARVHHSPYMEQEYDEWLITPDVVLPGEATACSLTFKTYYDDGGTFANYDSALIKISTDGGSNWTILDTWGSNQGSDYEPFFANYDVTSYAGQSVRFCFQLRTFGYVGFQGIDWWFIDKVNVWADDVSLLFEDFNDWGIGGYNPPAGWEIFDYGIPKPGQGIWNNNDYHDYTRWGSKSARIYYTDNYAEWQDEWMISPSFAISSGAICSLSVVEYYNHSTSGTPWQNEDHGYIKITTDAGTTWNTIFDNDATKGSPSNATTFSYDISMYAGNTCEIAFHFVNSPAGSDYWIFDDVLVTELIMLAHDVMTAGINSPTWGISGYDNNVSTTVANIGLNTETFDDSTVIINLNKTNHVLEGFGDPPDWTGANPPAGWVVLDSGSTPGWDVNDWHQWTYFGIWGDVARVYEPSSNDTKHTYLITPSMNLSGETEVYLTFRAFFAPYSGIEDSAQILGTTDDWATTQVLDTWTTTQGSADVPYEPVYEISSWAAGNSNVKIAFRLYSTSSLVWRLDDVNIYSPHAPTIDYASSETVASLESFEVRDVDYSATWSPTANDYIVKSFTNLSTDEDNSNDTMSLNITVYEHYESGGPDAGNYSWDSDKDGGTGDPYNWIDITTSGTPVTWDAGNMDNQYTYGIPLGFSFTFYDIAYDRIYLSMNGCASFDTITSHLDTNYHIPDTLGQDNILALLWDDLSDESGGIAYYYTNNSDTFIVSYENWDFDADLDQRIDMQLILTAGDRGIKYQYKEVGPVIYTSHSIGIEDDPGNIGLEFAHNDYRMGNIAMSGLAITFGYNPPTIDAALSSIDDPFDGSMVFNGTTVTPTITVLNYSDSDYTIPVTFLITDGTTGDTVYNQSESTALVTGGGGSLQHAFSVTWNADPDGDYDVEAFTSLAGDANPANDTEITDFMVATHYGTGGPDDFGYRWIDNSGISDEDPPVFAYIDLSDSPTADTISGSGNYGNFPIGFGFKYYGVTFDSVYIISYGMLQFGYSYSGSLNDCPVPDFSDPNMPFMGGFWDFGYCNAAYDGACMMETFGTEPNRYTVIQFHNWRLSGYNMEWEIILHENGDIVMQYLDIDEAGSDGAGQSAMVGLEDWNGNATGLGYLCNDSPVGNRLSDSLAIKWYKSVYAHDVMVDEFNVPSPAGIVNVAFTPEVQFSNVGINRENHVPVRLTINPGGYNDVQSIPVLHSGTSVAQQFTQFTPTATGSYTLVATSELVGDEDPRNDTLILQFAAFDYFLDFEADDGDLTGGGDWEWGAPNNPEGPANAYSGSNLWATNLSGDYTATLSTLEFDLGVGTTNPSIGVASWYDTESGYDGGNFGISTDGGSSWITVSPDIGYDDTTSSDNPLNPDSIFTGNYQKFWDFVNFDLTAFAGTNVRARFAFGADGAVFYPGWHLDDLAFADCQIVEGSIGGTVTDANTAGPLEGAIVEANGNVKDTTDVTGAYAFDIGPGDVEVTISKAGYNSNTDTVTVVNGQTTTHDVVLTAPIGSIDTSPIVDNVAPGDTATYSRYLHNSGSGPMTYSVAINFNLELKGFGGYNIRSNTVLDRISNAGRDDNSTDYAPFHYGGGNVPVITDIWDDLTGPMSLDMLGDGQILGIEYDGTDFYFTGGNRGLDPNKLYVLHPDGSADTLDQQGTTGWGWRDLAYDGTFLYGSAGGSVVDQIDPATGNVVTSFPGPEIINRGLARNPENGHFFTADYVSQIHEFDATQTYNSWANYKPVYGMAWDDLSEDGPWLWVFSQNGPPDTLMEISQFDPVGGTYTGVSYQVTLEAPYTQGIAGGACFTTEYDPSVGAIFIVSQAVPYDFFQGFEIAPHETWFSVIEGGSGEVAPGDSAEIVFMADMRDSEIVADSTYNAEANVNDNSVSPTHVIPVSITAAAGGCDYIPGDCDHNGEPATLPDVIAMIGMYRGTVVHPYECDCPPHGETFGATADPNGNCIADELPDVVAEIGIYRGTVEALGCEDCPGSLRLLPGDGERQPVVPSLKSKMKIKKGKISE